MYHASSDFEDKKYIKLRSLLTSYSFQGYSNNDWQTHRIIFLNNLLNFQIQNYANFPKIKEWWEAPISRWTLSSFRVHIIKTLQNWITVAHLIYLYRNIFQVPSNRVIRDFFNFLVGFCEDGLICKFAICTYLSFSDHQPATLEAFLSDPSTFSINRKLWEKSTKLLNLS